MEDISNKYSFKYLFNYLNLEKGRCFFQGFHNYFDNQPLSVADLFSFPLLDFASVNFAFILNLVLKVHSLQFYIASNILNF